MSCILRYALLGLAMGIDAEFRRANKEDADAVSQLIITTLRASNISDYSSDMIRFVEKNFTPDAVRSFLEKHKVFVAAVAGKIIGTARLDGSIVRTIFVAPDMQRFGIGTQLMTLIELEAQANGVDQLTVPSSVTAEAFFKKLGFSAVRSVPTCHGPTVIMVQGRKE